MKENNYIHESLQLNNSLHTPLLLLLEKLKNISNVSNFSYMKIYSNKRLYISSNPQWFNHYVENKFFNNYTHNSSCYISSKEVSYIQWNDYKLDDVFKSAIEFNIWNGFSIMKNNANSIEVFNFSGSKNDTCLNKYYINNLDALYFFIMKFKELLSSYKKRQDLSKAFLQAEEFCIQKPFLSETDLLKEFSLNFPLKSYELESSILTKRQTQCLLRLLQGKSSKEIAHDLLISNRTAELYIDQIKKKLNVTYKGDLINKVLSDKNFWILKKFILSKTPLF